MEVLSAIRKSSPQQSVAIDQQITEIAEDLDELRATERRKLSTMSQDEAPLLDEFRTAFQEVSRWINRAEAQLGTNRESQERAVGQEIDEWAPKMTDLRRMAEKLVQLFINQRQDVEPEMDSLHQRWEHVVRQVEKRIKDNQAFRMVEVEEIKTTISHLTIPLSEPVVTVTQPSPVVDPDEEIETLIEDDSQSKARFNNDASPMPGESSSESLSGDTITQQSTKSPPPQPLPKPRWYLEQRAKGIKMPVSPERVKVIQNTLPSPQKLVGTVEALPTDEMQMAEKTVVLSTSTTPSTTLDSPASTIADALDDDVLAKDNAVIDHLLAETEHQLEEVAKHVRGLVAIKDKEQMDFEEKTRYLIEKIEASSRKIDEAEYEQDLQLRKDLVAMEVKMLEAEVKGAISCGERLLIVTKRKSPKDHDAMLGRLTDLKNVWKTLQSRTDQMKSTITETEVKLKQFRKEMDLLKRWMSSAKVKLVRAAHDDKVAKQFVTEVKNRKPDVDHLNVLASQLQQRNALSGHEIALNIINADWQEIVERMKTMAPSNSLDTSAAKPAHEINSKLSTAPGSPLMRSAPVEVATRMAKMMDALAAIDRQMDTQTLSSDRPCENLEAQSEALATVKNALDRLRPTLKQTDQDLDRLSSANISMEYFEKLSNSNSKLHKEWDKVRYRYAQRQELCNDCKRLEAELHERKYQLEIWLRNIGENSSAQVSNHEIETKGKLAAELTNFCKEFMTKTSAQEALAIQSQVDALLRRWRSVLAILTNERKAAFSLCEKVEKMSKLMGKAINSSDKRALQSAIKDLSSAQSDLGQLRQDFCQRINDEGIRDPTLLKARTTLERLAITIPRRIEYLHEKEERLADLHRKRGSLLAQIEEISSQMRASSNCKSVQLSVANLQYEVNRVLNDYVSLEREVSTNHFDARTSHEMQSLKSAWIQLSADSRHLQIADGPKRPTDLGGSVSDAGTTLTSPQSSCSITNESCVSPTTCSQSSFLSDESQVDFDDLAVQIEKELRQILEDSTQLNLAVDDPAAIRSVVEQQQQVMRQLENKRDSLDHLGNRLMGKSSTNASVLQSRLGVLRDQLDVTKHRVLSRKSECTAMASDSEQFTRKLKEIDSWLCRLDGILETTHPVGQTLDVLEYQHQSAMDAIKELSKYEHHIRLFIQVCERMSHVYGRDDTSKIEQVRNRTEMRHKTLVSEFTKRRNEIQAMQNSFASFDKSIDRFFEWLFEVETTVEDLESQSEASPKSKKLLWQKFEDTKNEIHDKDRVFNALNTTGTSLVNKMADEEKTMLGRKLSEMSMRWKSLQNKMLDVNMHLRPCTEKEDEPYDTEASFSHVSLAHANLRDHTDWVLRKKRELSSLSLDGDVKGLRRQLEEHNGFKHQLTERGTQIRNSLNVGHKLSDKVKDTRPDFNSCVKNLEMEWQELNERSTEWYDDILRMMENVKSFEDRINELNKT